MKFKFAELTKYISEFFYYLVSVAMEGSKDKGWQPKLFVWCFILAILIVAFLIVKTLVIPLL